MVNGCFAAVFKVGRRYSIDSTTCGRKAGADGSITIPNGCWSGSGHSSSFAPFAATLAAFTPTFRPLGGQPQRRHRYVDYLERSSCGRPINAWSRFHDVQDGPPLGGDPPATVFTPDEALRKYIEVRHARSQPLGAFGPVATAGRQYSHVALDVVHHGEAVRVAHQDLQHRDLKIHRRVSLLSATWSAPRKGLRARPA